LKRIAIRRCIGTFFGVQNAIAAQNKTPIAENNIKIPEIISQFIVPKRNNSTNKAATATEHSVESTVTLIRKNSI